MQVNIKTIQISVLEEIPNIYKTSTITIEQKELILDVNIFI